MSDREARRLDVIVRLDAGTMTAREAAESMELSPRQTYRLLKQYRTDQAAGLVHGNRGRKPKHTLDQQLAERVVTLAQTDAYRGCNHQHFTELLAEREDIHLSRSSVRRLLTRAGLTSPRTRRPPQHRQRRERRSQEGMLLQMDGSPHAWLEERGPALTLVAAIDDATGTIPGAIFRAVEDSEGYLRTLRMVVQHRGVPLAVYHDRHSIFQVNRGEPTIAEQLRGAKDPSQVGRVLQDLGIASIAAQSPEAKGRVERLFGTLQDRLVVELRLAGATTLEEANQVLQHYVPKFNKRFAVTAAQAGCAYRSWPAERQVDDVFCFKEQRVVAHDNTVRYQNQIYQILPTMRRASYAKTTVEVRQLLSGRLVLAYQGEKLPYRRLPPVTKSQTT